MTKKISDLPPENPHLTLYDAKSFAKLTKVEQQMLKEVNGEIRIQLYDVSTGKTPVGAAGIKRKHLRNDMTVKGNMFRFAVCVSEQPQVIKMKDRENPQDRNFSMYLIDELYFDGLAPGGGETNLWANGTETDIEGHAYPMPINRMCHCPGLPCIIAANVTRNSDFLPTAWQNALESEIEFFNYSLIDTRASILDIQNGKVVPNLANDGVIEQLLESAGDFSHHSERRKVISEILAAKQSVNSNDQFLDCTLDLKNADHDDLVVPAAVEFENPPSSRPKSFDLEIINEHAAENDTFLFADDKLLDLFPEDSWAQSSSLQLTSSEDEISLSLPCLENWPSELMDIS
jgi:hypothetical protein